MNRSFSVSKTITKHNPWLCYACQIGMCKLLDQLCKLCFHFLNKPEMGKLNINHLPYTIFLYLTDSCIWSKSESQVLKPKVLCSSGKIFEFEFILMAAVMLSLQTCPLFFLRPSRSSDFMFR